MQYLAVLMFAVFFAGFAMTVNEGLWSNAISLLCVMLAAVIAVPGGLALAGYVIAQAQPAPENEWAFKFCSVWGIFFFAVMILRIATDRISRVRMKFLKPLDVAGGILVGLVVSLMLTSFTAMMLYVPFAASVWKVEEAASWQNTTIQSFAGPMTSVVIAFYGDDVSYRITKR